MIFFGPPECPGGLYLGDNAFGFEAALCRKLVNLCLGLRLLLRRVEEDGGAVLRAPVRTLAVEGSGVVEGEKGVEELVVGDAGGVEVEFDDFGVASGVGADIFVAGAVKLAALIADGGCGDAGDGATEASTPQKQPAPKVAFSMLMAVEMRGRGSG